MLGMIVLLVFGSRFLFGCGCSERIRCIVLWMLVIFVFSLCVSVV